MLHSAVASAIIQLNSTLQEFIELLLCNLVFQVIQTSVYLIDCCLLIVRLSWTIRIRSLPLPSTSANEDVVYPAIKVLMSEVFFYPDWLVLSLGQWTWHPNSTSGKWGRFGKTFTGVVIRLGLPNPQLQKEFRWHRGKTPNHQIINIT